MAAAWHLGARYEPQMGRDEAAERLAGWHAAVERARSRADIDDEECTVTDTHEWPGSIAAITLFVEDLDSAKRFYLEVFELPIYHEDDNSVVFRFGDTLIDLLKAAKRPELVEPAHGGEPR